MKRMILRFAQRCSFSHSTRNNRQYLPSPLKTPRFRSDHRHLLPTTPQVLVGAPYNLLASFEERSSNTRTADHGTPSLIQSLALGIGREICFRTQLGLDLLPPSHKLPGKDNGLNESTGDNRQEMIAFQKQSIAGGQFWLNSGCK